MPSYNKAVINGVTYIDLSKDTVTTDNLLNGYTAHDKNGALITGTMNILDSYNDLNDKPQINSVELIGNKTFIQLGLLDFFYPVGSYYETSDTSFDPNVTWGGTWELETEGQVHVSSGNNYSIVGAVTNTSDGGESEHLLTHEESGVPSHNHSQNSHVHSIAYPCFAGDSGKLHYETGGSIGGSGNKYAYIDGSSTNRYVSGVAGSTATNNPNTETDATTAHNNMQPYIVVNRWHRIPDN